MIQTTICFIWITRIALLTVIIYYYALVDLSPSSITFYFESKKISLNLSQGIWNAPMIIIFFSFLSFFIFSNFYFRMDSIRRIHYLAFGIWQIDTEGTDNEKKKNHILAPGETIQFLYQYLFIFLNDWQLSLDFKIDLDSIESYVKTFNSKNDSIVSH